MKKTLTINYLNADLCYSVYGSGDNILLGFHGYGQDGSVFKEMSSVMKNFTIYTFDLFYHGDSVWRNEHICLTDQSWKEFMDQFLEREQIERFDLIGFSLGCRLVFSMIGSFEDRINKVTLIAPDGISNSIIYSLATLKRGNRSFFSFLLKNSKSVLALLKFSRKLGLIDRETHRIASKELSHEDNRRRLFKTWNVFRDMNIVSGKMINTLNQGNIEVIFIVAQRDPIIKWNRIKAFYNGLDNRDLIQIRCQHNLLVEASTRRLKEYFQAKN